MAYLHNIITWCRALLMCKVLYNLYLIYPHNTHIGDYYLLSAESETKAKSVSCSR